MEIVPADYTKRDTIKSRAKIRGTPQWRLRMGINFPIVVEKEVYTIFLYPLQKEAKIALAKTP